MPNETIINSRTGQIVLKPNQASDGKPQFKNAALEMPDIKQKYQSTSAQAKNDVLSTSNKDGSQLSMIPSPLNLADISKQVKRQNQPEMLPQDNYLHMKRFSMPSPVSIKDNSSQVGTQLPHLEG